MEPGFLTDKEIIEEKDNLFAPGSFDEKNATHASYDLRLGEEAYISGKDYPQRLSDNDPFITIPRGQFALLIAKEYIKLPNDYLGLISIRFGIKAQGLINVSGFHVDPGFEGKILFSVFNAGPMDVVLKYNEPTFMIFFYKLKEKVGKSYVGERQKQEGLPVALVTSLKGTSTSLSDVDKRVSQLETINKIQWALIITLIAALIALFLKGAFGS
jgi:dCTP deaminase